MENTPSSTPAVPTTPAYTSYWYPGYPGYPYQQTYPYTAAAQPEVPPGVASTSTPLQPAHPQHAYYYQQYYQYQQSARPTVPATPTKLQKPAYIPIKVHTTTISTPSTASTASSQPPTTKSEPPKQHKAGEWPQALKDYVTKVFDICPPEKKDFVENQLRELIVKVTKNNALWSTDWSTMAVPSVCLPDQPKVEEESPSNKRKKKQPQQQPKKMKLDDDALSSLDPVQMSQELSMREKRAQRFVPERASSPVAHLSQKTREMSIDENLDSLDWDPHAIVGTCTTLEKRYLRLTSAPDPSTVRPLHILKQTLELLREKWKQEQNYTYICDQFKSLRQDLTVQRIKNDFTVKVYESHARIALEKKDLGEYNQCQGQLYELYKLGIMGNKEEFLGYRVLYMVHTMNKSELHHIMLSLTEQEKQEPSVAHALAVRSAISLGDYHTLFQLYNNAPNMSGYMMDHFVERERFKAMKTICRAYRTTVSVDFIATELGFILPIYLNKGNVDGDTEMDVQEKEDGITSGLLECKLWLEENGVILSPPPSHESFSKLEELLAAQQETQVTKSKQGKKRAQENVNKLQRDYEQCVAQVRVGSLVLDCKNSTAIFMNKVQSAAKIDIKGQVH